MAPLPEPPIIKREQWELLKSILEEIQEHALTNVRSEDGSITCDAIQGEGLFSATSEPAFTGTLTLAKTPVWDAPVLSYTPVILTFEAGRLVGAVEESSVTIDTAEACA